MATDPQMADPGELQDARILVVDDNVQNLELMQAYLEGLGCTIETAADGVEAMQIVETNPPDLILLDVMMPRMSGFEVCRKVKANPVTRDVVIIMVTALNEVADFERAVECGTNDFIAKPVNKHELLTRVKSLLQLRLLKRQFDQIGAGDMQPSAADVHGLLDQGDRIMPPPVESADESDQSD
ncbi:MAG: response regulator [Phycisphaerales bacterium]|nr:response regulator [Phycisphaerales bacterium]